MLKAAALALALAGMPGLSHAATDRTNLSIAELAAIEMVNGYINDIRTMQGNFVQTAPDGQVTQGRFFIERPGKMRFDYEFPSTLTVISDGTWVAVQDRRLKTTERYPLATTPLRMFLSRQVDLMNDARVVDVDPGGERGVSITMQDPSNRADGTLTLYFDPVEHQLDSWIVSDAQGLDTQVEFRDIVRGQPIEASYFRIVEDTAIEVDQHR
jgi:outer membrane lipoprotein-sorting protein